MYLCNCVSGLVFCDVTPLSVSASPSVLGRDVLTFDMGRLCSVPLVPRHNTSNQVKVTVGVRPRDSLSAGEQFGVTVTVLMDGTDMALGWMAGAAPQPGDAADVDGEEQTSEAPQSGDANDVTEAGDTTQSDDGIDVDDGGAAGDTQGQSDSSDVGDGQAGTNAGTDGTSVDIGEMNLIMLHTWQKLRLFPLFYCHVIYCLK